MNRCRAESACIAETQELEPRVVLTTYVIDPVHGSDQNAVGTMDAPFRTMRNLSYVEHHPNANYRPLEAGDTVLLRDGIHNWSDQILAGETRDVVYLLGAHGTAAAPITIAAYPGEHPLIQAKDAVATQTNLFGVDNASHLRISGLEITGTYGPGIAVADSTDIEIDHNNIHDIDGHTVDNIAGIHTLEIVGLSIHDNLLHDNYDHDFTNPNHVNSRNIVVFGDGTDRVQIYNNTVFNTPDPLGRDTGAGIWIKHASEIPGATFDIHDNIVRDVSYTAIGGQSSGLHVHNNLIVAPRGAPYVLGGGDNLGDASKHLQLTDIRIENNTFVGTPAFSSFGLEDFNYPTSGFLTFRNNIVVDTATDYSASNGIITLDTIGSDAVFGRAASPANLNFDRNVYFNPTTDPRWSVFAYDNFPGTEQRGGVFNFNQWKSLGIDTHSIVADPQLNDLYLPQNSAAAGAGWLASTSPHLSVLISNDNVIESAGANASTLSVIRSNVNLSQPLTVTLSVSDASEISLPTTVTIPAGASFVRVPITALNDHVQEPTRAVEIVATASGSLYGSEWLRVRQDPSAIPVAANGFDTLVAGVAQITTVGAPGPIYATDGNWTPIVSGDDDSSFPSTFVAARSFGAGRVIAFGHDGIFSATGTLDNGAFLENVTRWLDASGNHQIRFTTGHNEWIQSGQMSGLSARLNGAGYRFSSLSGAITSDKLASTSVLVIGNAWGDFSAAEIAAVRQFVAAGGGLCLVGLGWSWQPYHPGTTLDDYPMTKMAEPFAIRWLDSIISDPTNQLNGSPVFHTLYPNAPSLSISEALRTIRTAHAAHPSDLSAALESDATLRLALIRAHMLLSVPAAQLPEGDPLRRAVFGDLTALATDFPQSYARTAAFDQSAFPTATWIRERFWRTWRDCMPLNSEVVATMISAGHLSGGHASLLRDHGVVVLDNLRLSANQVDFIDRYLDAIPASLQNLRAISVLDDLGVRPPAITIDGLPGYVNVFPGEIGSVHENPFPNDVTPITADTFVSALAHEVNHVVNAYTIGLTGNLAARQTELVTAAGRNPQNYLRSMFDAGTFADAPQEFFASISNQWFCDSQHTLELGMTRFAAGRSAPLNQALFFAEVYSQGGAATHFYRIDSVGHILHQSVPLHRDANGHIDQLTVGTTEFHFSLDARGNVLSASRSNNSPTMTVVLPASGGPFQVVRAGTEIHVRGRNGIEIGTAANFSETTQIVIRGSDAADLVTLDSSMRGFRGGFAFQGGAGADKLDASRVDFAVSMDGGTGNDTLFGGDGNDVFLGGDNDDLAKGAGGNDTLTGGFGNDQLFGENGADALDGGAGNDNVDGGNGDSDTVTGGLGNDTLAGGGGVADLLMETVNGSLTMTSTGMSGVLGTDRYAGFEKVLLSGGMGNDLINASSATLAVTLRGGEGDDTLLGGGSNDFLNGGAGNDSLVGNGGNDLLIGDSGNDSLLGSAGSDILLGGTGDDSLSGSTTLNAGNSAADGNDTILGGAGNDRLFGGVGNDILSGEDGNDTLFGDAGTDRLYGGAGTDSPIRVTTPDVLDADGVFADATFFDRLNRLLSAPV